MSVRNIADNVMFALMTGSHLCGLSNLILSCCTEWEQYVKFDSGKYNRALIARNDYVDVVIISWEEGQQSGLHDHPSNGCIMHILQGELDEDVYTEELVLIKTNHLTTGQTTFIQGSEGIHNIRNGNTRSVSIHVYSPPDYKITFY